MEGMPMTIVEAYSCGTPVIAPDFGNAGAMVIEKKTGYHYNPNSVESCIHALTSDLRLNEEVCRHYHEYYSDEASYRLLMEIYGKELEEEHD